jgi:hypothetical protein
MWWIMSLYYVLSQRLGGGNLDTVFSHGYLVKPEINLSVSKTTMKVEHSNGLKNGRLFSLI